jgi:acyl-CoA reductase-like NAD-dependent aldehyde dehydrogenase
MQLPIALQNLVNGQWVGDARSGNSSLNPADQQQVVAQVPDMTSADVTAAIDAAATALPGWRSTPSVERGKLLFRVAALIRERAVELRHLISLEMGKTQAEAAIEVERSAEMLEFYAGIGRLPYGDLIPDRRPGVSAWTVHEPIGVVLAITPWNDPLMVPCRKIAPALISGNTVVLKPSPDTPGIALILAQMFVEAGVPPGVLNTVTGDVSVMGEALVRDPRIAGVTFTGSTATGKYLRKTLSDGRARLQTEMGGKNSAVLMPDADIDAALKLLVPSIFGQTGQRCTAVSRLLVHRSIIDRVERELSALAREVKVGEGSAETTTMGPVVNERARQKVLSLVDAAMTEGAKVAYGGAALKDEPYARGCFVQPTVLTGVTTKMRIWKEEIFGPVVAVLPFDTLEEVIGMVNDTEYGLAAGIFTNDLAAAHTFIERVEAGQAVINLPPSGWDVHQPFGGFKDSGSPFKEHGLDGLAFYTRIKTAAMSFPAHR